MVLLKYRSQIPPETGIFDADNGLEMPRPLTRNTGKYSLTMYLHRPSRTGGIMDYRAKLDLTGKLALVTGAGQGIGAAIAEALAMTGAEVICTDILPDRAEATAGELRAQGLAARAEALDVTDSAAIGVRHLAPDGSESSSDTPLAWPANLVSLGHVALPFPPDDPVYGFIPGSGHNGVPSIGSWLLRKTGRLKPALRTAA